MASKNTEHILFEQFRNMDYGELFINAIKFSIGMNNQLKHNLNTDFWTDPIEILRKAKMPSKRTRGGSTNTYFSSIAREFCLDPPKYLYKYSKFKDVKSSLEKDYLFFMDPRHYKNNEISFDDIRDDSRIDFKSAEPFLDKNLDSLWQVIGCDVRAEENFNYSELFSKIRGCLQICCLTEEKNNLRMWDQYADSGTGASIIIDSSNLPVVPYKVRYVDSFNTGLIDIIYRNVSNYKDDVLEPSFYSVVSEVLLQVYHKQEQYRWEREWRLIHHSASWSYKMNVEQGTFVGVIPGPNMEEKNVQVLKNLCFKKGIKFCPHNDL